jgi:dienelactone hydrolase
MVTSLLLTSLLAFGGAPPKEARETVFDLKAILAPPLNARVRKKTEKDGIITEEVMFHSEKDGTKDVEIFAFFSYPKNAAKLPAFIWNQGGLAQASSDRTEFGARRGYATLCIDFPMPGYRSTGKYPIVSGLELGDDPKQAPIYHGAVALLRAVSFLESRPEVDKNKIGMAGSSWGGFYTTLMVGLDPRLKAGSCLFGCGRLDLGNLWWDGNGWNTTRDPAFRERWRTTLDPAWRLAGRETPIAWFTGTNDLFYWLPSVMASHERAAGPKHLSLLPNWSHALTQEVDEQVFAWLDVHLKGAPAFIEVSPVREEEAGGNLQARWQFQGPRKVMRGELMLSHGEAGNWKSRPWRTIPAEIRGQTCLARLPKGGFPYFVSGTVIDTDGFRYSTPIKRIERSFTEEKPDYDGCAPWGAFEEEHYTFLRRHGYPATSPSKDAKEGKQSAALQPGKTTWFPVYFTSGVPHRLSLFAKAKAQTNITIALSGVFDGKPQTQRKTLTVGPTWTEVSLDFTPPRTLMGRLLLDITTPRGSEVLLDAVQFRLK